MKVKMFQVFLKVVVEDAHEKLPPLQNIQHQIDANLLNLPHYHMSPKESDILQRSGRP